jgi:hypothetical protein
LRAAPSRTLCALRTISTPSPRRTSSARIARAHRARAAPGAAYNICCAASLLHLCANNGMAKRHQRNGVMKIMKSERKKWRKWKHGEGENNENITMKNINENGENNGV